MKEAIKVGVGKVGASKVAASKRGAKERALARRKQQGVTLIEYALLAGLIAVALVACLGELSAALQAVFEAITAALIGSGAGG